MSITSSTAVPSVTIVINMSPETFAKYVGQPEGFEGDANQFSDSQADMMQTLVENGDIPVVNGLIERASSIDASVDFS